MTDEQLMLIAIEEAKIAESHGDIPIGALVVLEGDIISSRHNERELQNDPTAHAEVLAIQDAAKKLGTSRLYGATLISTLEPCPMCAGAIVHCRLARVVFGVPDPKGGAAGGAMNILQFPSLHPKCDITPRIMESDCRSLLQTFFEEKRKPSSGQNSER